MSQDGRGPRGPGGPTGGGSQGTGSVRRARERMNAQFNLGLPDQNPLPRPSQRMPMQRPNEGPRYPAPQQRRQGPMPAALSARNTPGGISAAISRPTPVAQNAQWPLPEDVPRSPAEKNRSPPRGPPPQRPPRPSNVPSLLDSSRIQDYTPSFPNRPPQRQDQDTQAQILSPFYDSNDSSSSSNSPRTPNRYSSDRPSTSSSAGSIPDFPIPNMPPTGVMLPVRRAAPQGPPPTVRRGPSSYYSQASFVSPIPEEMPESLRGGGSYASSRAIPSSWGSRPDNFSMEAYEDNIEEEDETVMGSPGSSQHSEAGLVRQASLGKKAKPTLRTINSGEETPTRRQEANMGGAVGRGIVAAGAAGGIAAAGFGNKTQEDAKPSGNRTIPLELSSSDSDIPNIRSKSPMTSPTDPNAPVFGEMNIGRVPSMSEKRPSARRPPRLNIDAVRDAEARGSLTSLPDLIRRATKLASNLDRGKTASRLGIMDIMYAEGGRGSPFQQDLKQQDLQVLDEKRRSGSISDILASFPPPALGTPTADRDPGRDRPVSRWPTPFSPGRLQQYDSEKEYASQDRRQRKKQRKCCGMRPLTFVALLLVLFLLIAAAVVIPVVLLVILPRMRNASSTAAAAADTSSSACSSSNMCKNGGVAIFQNNQCRCVCVNGFTGATCNVAGDAGCTTTQQGSTNNATVGNAIPRLFSTASANFSIPINDQDVLSLFSISNLSCTSENAIVAFNGQSSKRFYIPPKEINWAPEDLMVPVIQTKNVPMPQAGSPVMEIRSLHEPFVARQDTSVAATTNGILYEPTATTTLAATTAPQTVQATATESSSSSASASGLTLTADVLDFARIVVLFILDQTNELSSAVAAQEKIQNFFAGTMSPTSWSTSMSGQNFTLNFSNFSISVQNGTSVGGKGDGNGGLTTTDSTA